MQISDSAVSYAVSKNDVALEMSVKLTKTGLANLSQVTLYDTLSNFYKVVQPLGGSLKHIEAGDIEKLGALLADYKAAIPKTSANTSETKTATLNIGDTIKQINELYVALDKHMAPYKYVSPNFYNDYMNSRGVKDLRKKGKKKDDNGEQGEQ